MHATDIPTGYFTDSQGRLVPQAQVRTIDKLRDDLVRRLVDDARRLNAEIARAKALYFGEVDAFIEMSLREYGVERGGEKGNVTLLSYDGRLKVVRAVAEVIKFDERLQAAKALIDACLTEWSSDARSELRTIVQDAFRVDQQQNIRVQQVLSLRRLEIEDPRWRKAMQAIGESIEVVRTKSYVRFYERVGDSDQWVPIPLDIAAVPA